MSQLKFAEFITISGQLANLLAIFFDFDNSEFEILVEACLQGFKLNDCVDQFVKVARFGDLPN
jgi:hypothetical protein